MGQIPSSLGPPDVIYPAVNDYRQQQFQVEPEREVAVSLLGAQVVHDLRLVQLRLQLVTQISRHCRETQSKLEPSPTPPHPTRKTRPSKAPDSIQEGNKTKCGVTWPAPHNPENCLVQIAHKENTVTAEMLPSTRPC